MKKLLLILIAAAMLASTAALAEEGVSAEATVVTAGIGDISFEFTNEQAYFDVTYSFSSDYPADFDYADFARTFVQQVALQ